jgi:microsomal dipeptidase-like Zn-dependent dipeptidase
MTAYLASIEGARPGNINGIGCAVPYLKKGNVKLQVMAIWTATGEGSLAFAARQIRQLQNLISATSDIFVHPRTIQDIQNVMGSDQAGVLAGIENTSSFAGEGEPLRDVFRRLEEIRKSIPAVLYISFCHSNENRFAGGNATKAGLKKDGRELLDFMHGKKIAVDLSHASFRSMSDILEHIDRNHLAVPVMASHSNFCSVYEHSRNLPDDIAKEIIRRKGLIGINFVRAFVHPHEPAKLLDHILYGFELGGSEAVCFGADFFHWQAHADEKRIPYYFPDHENAGKYQEILHSLQGRLGFEQLNDLAFNNVFEYIKRECVIA